MADDQRLALLDLFVSRFLDARSLGVVILLLGILLDRLQGFLPSAFTARHLDSVISFSKKGTINLPNTEKWPQAQLNH